MNDWIYNKQINDIILNECISEYIHNGSMNAKKLMYGLIIKALKFIILDETLI